MPKNLRRAAIPGEKGASKENCAIEGTKALWPGLRRSGRAFHPPLLTSHPIRVILLAGRLADNPAAARANHALIADVGRRFYELSDTQALYAADGVHPNEAGSHIAAEALAAVIQGHKEKQP